MTRRKVTKQRRKQPRPWTPMRRHSMTTMDGMSTEGQDPGEVKVEVWANDQYLAAVNDKAGPGLTHIMVRRHDHAPIQGWDDLQRIKNEVAGPELEAVELYPAESRLFDESNIRHLWLLQDQPWPIGYRLGRRTTPPGNGTRATKEPGPTLDDLLDHTPHPAEVARRA